MADDKLEPEALSLENRVILEQLLKKHSNSIFVKAVRNQYYSVCTVKDIYAVSNSIVRFVLIEDITYVSGTKSLITRAHNIPFQELGECGIKQTLRKTLGIITTESGLDRNIKKAKIYVAKPMKEKLTFNVA